jgi:polyphenol oxidase
MNWISPDWSVPQQVHAAVTLRTGGVSKGCYASLNLADHVGDDPCLVAGNRRILKHLLQLPAEPIWLHQVHGVRVIKADQAQTIQTADAAYTEQPGVVCVVLTADCLPVLFCGDHGRVIAAAHAGWRGLRAGVLLRTLDAMQCSHMQVWLGPAIGPEQFEVGEDVYRAFADFDQSTAPAFQPQAHGKWLADIYALAQHQLIQQGVDQIAGGGLCTVSDPARFYSYRRDGVLTGRMASLIWREASF